MLLHECRALPGLDTQGLNCALLCAVFDYQYTNADGIVFNKIIFISWCAAAQVQCYSLSSPAARPCTEHLQL